MIKLLLYKIIYTVRSSNLSEESKLKGEREEGGRFEHAKDDRAVINKGKKYNANIRASVPRNRNQLVLGRPFSVHTLCSITSVNGAVNANYARQSG
jgi:hypothetical protein